MKLLGIDFSTSHRSVALVECNGPTAHVLGRASETGTKATHAFQLIESALRDAKTDQTDVDALAVGLGPGSYGGIRVALSIAQGWQLARIRESSDRLNSDMRVAGVDSTVVLAETARRNGGRGRLNIVIDAQRKEFYLAPFELDADNALATAPIEIVSKSSVEHSIASGVPNLGPDVETALPGVTALHPNAAILAELAYQLDAFVPAEQLEPIYLRATSFVRAPAPRTDL